MATNKFKATEMVKSFSKDLKNEFVIICGLDGEGEEIDLRGMIRAVRGSEIDLTAFKHHISMDFTFHLYQFDHGLHLDDLDDVKGDMVDMLYMQILEPGPVLDFIDMNETEGG